MNLSNAQKKLRIKDQNKFVYENGWTVWASPTEKVTGGIFYPCGGEDEYLEVVFTADNENMINKVTNILPILTEDYDINKSDKETIIISISGYKKRKLNILIEKAINCIKCGACTTLCKNQALYLENNGIAVDIKKCNHCLKCLNTGKQNSLRGACIARNYSNKRTVIIDA